MKFKCHECNVQFTGSASLEHCPVCYELCAAEVRGPNAESDRLAGPNEAPRPTDLKGPNVLKTDKTPSEAPKPRVSPASDKKPLPKIAHRTAEIPTVHRPYVSATPKPVMRLSRGAGQAAVSIPTPMVRSRPKQREIPRPPPVAVVLPKPLLGASSQKSLVAYLRSFPSEASSPQGSKRRKVDDEKPALEASVSPPPTSATSVWSSITADSLAVLIGEGNFSFAYSLAKRLGTGRSIVATDVEMHHELKDNIFNQTSAIPGGGVCFGKLIELGATVSCNTDVSTLSVAKPLSLLAGSCDFLSWAFPHTRTPNRDSKCIPEHRNLLRAFIDEAAKMLKLGGIALITVKEGYPYNSWDVAGLKTTCMDYDTCEPFFPKDFPEYTHVTTIGAPIAEITPATTHVFKKVAEPGEQEEA